MELSTLPQRLVIIGGGYIGLEFAAMYANYGSMVTVLEYGNTFIPREDRDIANVIQTRLEELGVRFIFNAQVDEITDENELTTVSYLERSSGMSVKIPADAVLVATGRKASTASLNLEAAGVAVNERGEIIVNELLQTTVPHIWRLVTLKADCSSLTSPWMTSALLKSSFSVKTTVQQLTGRLSPIPFF